MKIVEVKDEDGVKLEIQAEHSLESLFLIFNKEAIISTANKYKKRKYNEELPEALKIDLLYSLKTWNSESMAGGVYSALEESYKELVRDSNLKMKVGPFS